MPEQHVQIMKGLGFSEDQIKTIEGLTPEQMTAWAAKPDDPENLKVFNPNELVTGIRTGMKNILSNDPDFLKSIPEDKLPKELLQKIEKGQYARFQNELEDVAIKKLGLDKNDLSDEDKKSIKGYVEKIVLTYATKKGAPEGLKEIQTKYSEALQNIERMKTDHEGNLKTELEKVTGANTAKLIKTLTKVELASLDDVQLAVAANFISDPVLSTLAAKYDIVLDANDNLDIKQKGQPNLDVLDKGGKKVTFRTVLREAVLENKLGTEIKDDGSGKGNTKTKVIIGDGGEGGQGNTDVADYIQKKIDQQPDIKPS